MSGTQDDAIRDIFGEDFDSDSDAGSDAGGGGAAASKAAAPGTGGGAAGGSASASSSPERQASAAGAAKNSSVGGGTGLEGLSSSDEDEEGFGGGSDADSDAPAAGAGSKKRGRLQKGSKRAAPAAGRGPKGKGAARAAARSKGASGAVKATKPRKRAAGSGPDDVPRKRKPKEGRPTGGDRGGTEGGSSVGTTAGSDGGKETGAGDDSEDSEAAVRTKADDEFIDNSGDDIDLLGEYQKDPEPKGGHGSDSDEADVDNRKTGRGVGDSNNVIDAVLKSMKRVKKQELSATDRESIAQQFLVRMNRCAEEDEAAVREGRPAMSKLRMLKMVQNHLCKKDLQETFLEYDLLSVAKKWLQPYPNGALPNITVRSGIIKSLQGLPIETGHLRRSGLGLVVMGLWKSDQETASNKAMLAQLIQRWNRPIFGKEINFSSLNHLLEERELQREMRRPMERSESAAARQRAAERAAAAARDAGEDVDIVAAARSRPVSDGKARVSVPFSQGRAFKFRPASKVDEEAQQERRTSQPAGRKSAMAKKMK